MDNRINEIRKEIRALRFCMLATEATMHEQVNQDKDCTETAGEILIMRAAMSLLARERIQLGDREPILVTSFFLPRRPPTQRPIVAGPVKQHLVPAEKRVR